MAAKLTAHQYADRVLSGLSKHVRALESKHGYQYVEDWSKVHKREAGWARTRLEREDFTMLDTETTGGDDAAEMIECAIIAANGKPVYDRLMRPRLDAIKSTATGTHGITERDLRKAPLFVDEYDAIQEALDSQPRILIYNAEFDIRIFNQTCFAHGRPPFNLPKVDDVMKRFARWCGDWNAKRHGFTWLKLDGGHRAAGDCRCMLALIYKMAHYDVPSWLKWDHGRSGEEVHAN